MRVITAAVLVGACVSLLFPAAASAAKCGGEVKRYKYEVEAAGTNGGTAANDDPFEYATRVTFSNVYRAFLRVCKARKEIRMKRTNPDGGSGATHTATYVKQRNPEVRCSWSEEMVAQGPLEVVGLLDSGNSWVFTAVAGVPFDRDPIFQTAYADVLHGTHENACGPGVVMDDVDGPPAARRGLLEAFAPQFKFPGIHIQGSGRGEAPGVLRKLVRGKSTRLDGAVAYPSFQRGTLIENGDWRVVLDFKRR